MRDDVAGPGPTAAGVIEVLLGRTAKSYCGTACTNCLWEYSSLKRCASRTHIYKIGCMHTNIIFYTIKDILYVHPSCIDYEQVCRTLLISESSDVITTNPGVT